MVPSRENPSKTPFRAIRKQSYAHVGASMPCVAPDAVAWVGFHNEVHQLFRVQASPLTCTMQIDDGGIAALYGAREVQNGTGAPPPKEQHNKTRAQKKNA